MLTLRWSVLLFTLFILLFSFATRFLLSTMCCPYDERSSMILVVTYTYKFDFLVSLYRRWRQWRLPIASDANRLVWLHVNTVLQRRWLLKRGRRDEDRGPRRRSTSRRVDNGSSYCQQQRPVVGHRRRWRLHGPTTDWNSDRRWSTSHSSRRRRNWCSFSRQWWWRRWRIPTTPSFQSQCRKWWLDERRLVVETAASRRASGRAVDAVLPAVLIKGTMTAWAVMMMLVVVTMMLERRSDAWAIAGELRRSKEGDVVQWSIVSEKLVENGVRFLVDAVNPKHDKQINIFQLKML